jgi:hypothetical protein
MYLDIDDCYLNGFDDKGKTGGGKPLLKPFPLFIF